MDPIEERDFEKLLAMMDDPRVQKKIADSFFAVPVVDKNLWILVPKSNVDHQQEGLNAEG